MGIDSLRHDLFEALKEMLSELEKLALYLPEAPSVIV
jgi:hypothetical protein